MLFGSSCALESSRFYMISCDIKESILATAGRLRRNFASERLRFCEPWAKNSRDLAKSDGVLMVCAGSPDSKDKITPIPYIPKRPFITIGHYVDIGLRLGGDRS
jgi:hypothetical protein